MQQKLENHGHRKIEKKRKKRKRKKNEEEDDEERENMFKRSVE